mmetsp:Transcript_58701/g.139793  ORF Transcript_58701/g.139793 Transcript_58701/m.139793 type:complete len:331 (-) Transcript_58701:215-1207(-)
MAAHLNQSEIRPSARLRKDVSRHRSSEPGVAEGGCPSLDLLLQGPDVRVAGQSGLEVFQLLPLLLLHLQGDLAAPVQEVGDLLKIGSGASSRGHGRGADADAARGEGRHVAVHCVAVQRDGALLAHLLHLATAQAVGAQVPKDEVVVRAVARELVALGHQGLGQGIRIGLDLLGVFLELRSGDLQQLRSQAADLVVVGSTLQSREDGHVNPVLDVRHLLGVLEEDHASSRPAQRLVGGGGHNVAVLEGRRMLPGGDQPGDVGDVCHQDRSNFVCDFTELSKVDDARVRGGSAEDHRRSEDEGCLAELIEIDKSGFWVHAVGQRLEVDGSR